MHSAGACLAEYCVDLDFPGQSCQNLAHIRVIKPAPPKVPQAHTFADLASTVATAAGRPAAFLAALAVVLAWAATGPVFHYSDTWQLVINTGTTIVTFLMVFLIQ